MRPAPPGGGGVWCDTPAVNLNHRLTDGTTVYSINTEVPALGDSLSWDTNQCVCDITTFYNPYTIFSLLFWVGICTNVCVVWLAHFHWPKTYFCNTVLLPSTFFFSSYSVSTVLKSGLNSNQTDRGSSQQNSLESSILASICMLHGLAAISIYFFNFATAHPVTFENWCQSLPKWQGEVPT